MYCFVRIYDMESGGRRGVSALLEGGGHWRLVIGAALGFSAVLWELTMALGATVALSTAADLLGLPAFSRPLHACTWDPAFVMCRAALLAFPAVCTLLHLCLEEGALSCPVGVLGLAFETFEL